jgi:hypothetical protein
LFQGRREQFSDFRASAISDPGSSTEQGISASIQSVVRLNIESDDV